MKNRNLLIFCGLIIAGVAFMSLRTGEKRYEYLYIIQSLASLQIVKPEDTTIKIPLRVKIFGHTVTGFQEALKKVQEFESEGWELVSNQITDTDSSSPQGYYLMRKAK